MPPVLTQANVGRPDASTRPWWIAGGMLGLAFGYFFWYTPYAMLTKALSSGLLPGMDKQVGGLVLMPAAAIGSLIATPLILWATGWWRYIDRRQVFGRTMRFPSRTMVIAGFFMALVIATTTLNYTFAGVSILFMLLMMRAGVLILSPIVDTARRRRVRIYSWIALGFSLLAVITALSDVNSYTLTGGAMLSLAVYFFGYTGRFQIMSRVAKVPDESVNRNYFAEEQVAAVVWQVVLVGLFALIGVGPAMGALREGFGSFLLTSAVWPALGVGALYSALFVYGSMIYLDPREYTWCVPANRCSSLFSGLVGSFLLTWLAELAAPGRGQLIATGFVFLAIAALSYPAIVGALRGTPGLAPRVMLFVCGGNTIRSPMAAAFARAELDSATWKVISAGTQATPGTPMEAEAVEALRELGLPNCTSNAQQLTPQLIADADVVFCMTDVHCAAALALAPDAAGKIHRLDPDGDVPDPHHKPAEAYRATGEQIKKLVTWQLSELGRYALPVPRGA